MLKEVTDWLSNLPPDANYHITPIRKGTPFKASYVNGRLDSVEVYALAEGTNLLCLPSKEAMLAVTNLPEKLNTRGAAISASVHGVIVGVDFQSLKKAIDGETLLVTPYRVSCHAVEANNPQEPLPGGVYIRERMLLQWRLRSWADHLEYRKRAERDRDLENVIKHFKNKQQYEGMIFDVDRFDASIERPFLYVRF